MTLLGQFYEWLSMLFLVQTQLNRSVEEILFDHNAEVIAEKLTWDDLLHFFPCTRRRSFCIAIYRRQELFMAKVMVVYGVIFFLVSLVATIGARMSLDWAEDVCLFTLIGMFICFSLVFWRLFCLMRYCQHFEYHRQRRTLLVEIVVIYLILIFDILFIVTREYDDFNKFHSQSNNHEHLNPMTEE